MLLDHKLKPYLLEVNHSPSFNVDSPLDLALKSAVLADTLAMISFSRDEVRALRRCKPGRLEPGLLERLRAYRTQYEAERVGRTNFERLFPDPPEPPPGHEQPRYDLYLKAAAELYGSAAVAGSRRNSMALDRSGADGGADLDSAAAAGGRGARAAAGAAHNAALSAGATNGPAGSSADGKDAAKGGKGPAAAGAPLKRSASRGSASTRGSDGPLADASLRGRAPAPPFAPRPPLPPAAPGAAQHAGAAPAGGPSRLERAPSAPHRAPSAPYVLAPAAMAAPQPAPSASERQGVQRAAQQARPPANVHHAPLLGRGESFGELAAAHADASATSFTYGFEPVRGRAIGRPAEAAMDGTRWPPQQVRRFSGSSGSGPSR